MDDDDFEDALARAAHGEVLTDLGASARLLDALLRVAAAPDAATRRPAMRAARLVHEHESGARSAEDAADDVAEEDAAEQASLGLEDD